MKLINLSMYTILILTKIFIEDNVTQIRKNRTGMYNCTETINL